MRSDGIYGIHGGDIAFHRAIFEEKKRLFGINTCRMHHEIPRREVICVADEAGMLLDNQSQYGRQVQQYIEMVANGF